jgi:hypothetical protein
MNQEAGRYKVFLEERRFVEAKESILNAKLALSDTEMKLKLLQLNVTDRQDMDTLVQSYTSLFDGAKFLADAKQLESQKDVLTWDTYNQMLFNYIKARNGYAEYYNKAINIQDLNIKAGLNLTSVSDVLKQLDNNTAEMQKKEMVDFIYANSFISKIDPLDKEVRTVAIEAEKTYGTELSQRIYGILSYFSENMHYVHTPNWNPKGSIQHIQIPGVTLSQQAGNCADLAILFCSLSESIGIPTMFCLVDTRHTEFEIQRSPELFEADHAAAQYFDRGKGWLFVDPTCYAGPDLQAGDTCNTESVKSATVCYDVEKFMTAVDTIQSQMK